MADSLPAGNEGPEIADKTPTPRPHDPLIGARIANCVIDRKIGSGGMASVYLAQHVGLNRAVAIKILSRDLLGSDANIKRFLHEARTAAALDHPNIATVYDVGEHEGNYYISMQYVDAQSLETMIGSRGPIPPIEAINIVREVAVALVAAHRLGIVHRDIKPANILIARDRSVKVVDFGLARLADSGQTFSTEGQIVGTPHYMAPEQAKGGQIDGRTDIYALGATFYHAVTGRRCFSGETPLAVVYKQMQEEPRPPHEVVASVPPIVSAVIAKMMAKNPAARYASADELIHALDGLRTAVPVAALPETGVETMLDLSMPAPPTQVTSTGPTRPLPRPTPPALTPPSTGPSTRRHLELLAERVADDREIAAAAVKRAFLSQEQVDDCLREVQRQREANQPVTLAAVFIARKLLEPVQIQALRAPASAPSVPLPAPSPERESEYVAGRIVGDYRLVRMISADDVGSYWEAQPSKPGRPVGLKLARNSDATIAKRLYAEAAKAKPLSHPHILRVHEVGTETDKKGSLVHYLVTDLVEGKSLGEIVGHAVDVRTIARHFEAAAEALHYAHEQNVFHANLKPSNMLVTRDNRLLLLYCDLGVRRDETRVFRERGTLQNAPYLAPEQVPGSERPADARTDVYRLGVLLYEVLTGRQPYSGLPSDVMRKILESPPTPPRQIKPALDPALEAIVLRAIEKDRDLRFQTARDMAHALHKFARSDVRQVDIAHGELKLSAGAHARKWWMRNSRRVLAAVALLALAVPGGYYGVRWLRWRFSEERRQSLEERYAALVESARRALAEGQYTRALMDAEEALRHRFTEDVAVIAREARTAVAELALTEHLETLRSEGLTPDLSRALERALEASAEVPPDSRKPSLLGAEGRALRALGRRDAAQARLEEALRAGAGGAPAHFALAHILVERWIEAILIDEAMPVESEIRERGAAWVRQAADHLRTGGDAGLSDVEAGVFRAFSALVGGDREAASRACEEEIVRQGTRPGTEMVLVAAAVATRDPQRRLKFLDAAVERRPDAGLALAMRGATHAAARRITEAASDFDAALAARFSPSCVHLLRGLAWLRVGDADRALQDFDRAAPLDAVAIDALNARARARMQKNDVAGALADADAACARAPEHRGSRLNRARLRLAAGKADLAAQDCDWIVDHHADFVPAYVIRGFARLDVRDPDGATRDFEHALKLDADDPGGWGGRAVVRLALGDARGAIADGERALKLAPADWPERGRVEAAVEAARKK